MSSNILSVYDTLAGWSITNIKVTRDIDEVKLDIKQGDLPMRILLPSTEGELGFIDIGKLTNIQWQIRDLCLWAPLSAGAGIEQYASDIVTYVKDYIDNVKNNRSPANNTNIVGMSVRISPVPWGENDYWSIDILLQVEEIL